MATTTSLGFSIFTTYKGSGARKAASELNRVAQTAQDVGKLVAASFGAASLAVTALGASALKAGIESNALQQRTNMALETLLGSTQAAQEQMNKLRAFGAESPIALPVWIRAQQQMISFGIETEKVVPMLTAIQDAVVAAGGTEEEIKGVVRALSQMASKGKLSAEELNQMGERGVDAAGVVAQAMNTTAGSIRSAITEGTLSVEDFFDGFIEGSKQAYGGAAENLRTTFTGTLDRLKGVHRRIGEIFATPLVDPNGGGALVEIGNAVADMLGNFEDAARPLADSMSQAIAPSVDKAAAAIRNFGESITTDKLREFVDTVRNAMPIITAFAVGGIAKMASGFIGAIPGLGGFAAALNPVATGITALAIASPDLRNALVDVLHAITPMIGPTTDLAIGLADLAGTAISILAPALSNTASILAVLTQNWKATLIVAAAVSAALIGMSVSAGASALGVSRLALSMYMLRSAMAAHPVLLMAGVVGTVAVTTGVLVNKLAELNRVTVDFDNNLGGAFSQIASTGRTSLIGLSGDLDTLTSGLKAADDAILTFKGEIMGLETDTEGLMWWEKLFGDKETIPVEEISEMNQQIRELDIAMAEAYESGLSESEILGILRNDFGATQAQIEQLLPLFFNYQEAIDKSEREQAAFTAEVGESVAALQGLADEMAAQTDPMFALRNAQESAREAQEAYNDAVSEHGVNSKEATDAAIAWVSAEMGVIEATEKAATLLDEGLSPALQQILEQSGMSAEAIQLVEEAMLDAGSEGQELADNIHSITQQMQDDWGTLGVASALEMRGMSEEAAWWAASSKAAIDSLIDSGWSFEDAIAEVARRSGVSVSQIEKWFEEARAAGLEFEDDYGAHMYVSGAGTVLSRLQSIKSALSRLPRFKRIDVSIGQVGKVPRFASGGPVIGAGTGTSDSIHAMLSNGEFVITADRVKALGGFSGTEALLRTFAGFAKGGPVSDERMPSYSRGGPVRTLPSQPRSGDTYHFHFNGPVANERQAEEMFVKAWKEAKRKNRIS